MAASSMYARRTLKSHRSRRKGVMVRYQPKSYTRSRKATTVVRQGELKGVDLPLSLTPIIATTNTSASSFVLNLVPPGTASWQRIGRKIRLQSVRLRGLLRYVYGPDSGTGEVNSNAVRMVVVWDKQPCGNAVPTFDTIFGRTVQAGTETCNWMDQLRYDNTDRFSVIRDSVYECNPVQTNSPVGTNPLVTASQYFDEFIKLGGRETHFKAQNDPATITDISNGALYVYFRTDQQNANTFVQVDGDSVSRLRYTD